MYTIVIPVLNQLRYTRQCVESLQRARHPGRIAARSSTTAAPTTRRSGSPRIPRSARCAIRQPRLRRRLDPRRAARRQRLGRAAEQRHRLRPRLRRRADRCRRSPRPAGRQPGAGGDGARLRPRRVQRRIHAHDGHARFATDWFHGVCFSVRRQVFERIGFPDTDRLLFGREDAEFRARCLRAGLDVGTVGAALIHHFGSITQAAMKKEQGVVEVRRPPLFLRQARPRLVGSPAGQVGAQGAGRPLGRSRAARARHDLAHGAPGRPHRVPLIDGHAPPRPRLRRRSAQSLSARRGARHRHRTRRRPRRAPVPAAPI